MKYNVDYFIKKFSAIPEDMWLVAKFREGDKGCVMGHCSRDLHEREDLETIFKNHSSLFSSLKFGRGACWVEQMVNNGDDPKYQQPTPRARILAALYDIKAMQQPAIEQYPDLTRQLAVLPSDRREVDKEETVEFVTPLNDVK